MINTLDTQKKTHVQKILEWRESLVKLPDNRFFDLMRMYLGEIKTPYNKQKLVEELGSFLHKESVKKNILLLLDTTDIQIISAVAYIDNAAQNKLSDFFQGTFTFSELYERLSNLEERLILYRNYDKDQNNSVIQLNPLLEDILNSRISISQLLPEPVYDTTETFSSDPLTPQFIAAFISYIRIHPDLCKIDLTFKKKAHTELSKIFPNSEKKLMKLLISLKTLLLIKENETGFFIDYKKFDRFSDLSQEMQFAYITAASCGQFGRNKIKKQAQFFLDLQASIPATGYTYKTLLRAAYLISISSSLHQSDSFSAGGRFNKLLAQTQKAQNNTNSLSENVRKDILELMIESAIEFGFFCIKGKNKEGLEIIAPAQLQETNTAFSSQNTLNINAVFSVTIMPGLRLKEILPLTQFLDIKHYDTVTQYEITKKSVMSAFNAGVSLDSIFDKMKQFTSFPIPQNLQMTVAEWYKSYKATTLYKGYILQVTQTNQKLIELNPKIAPYIYKKLTDGIYLLNVSSDKEALKIMKESNQDFTGTIHTIVPSTITSGFNRLLSGIDCIKKDFIKGNTADKNFSVQYEKDMNSYQDLLRKDLEQKEMPKDQKEGLENRINHKIILDKKQLQADSVHIEITEANGMDFTGKINIIEHAISEGLMLKVSYTESSLPTTLLSTDVVQNNSEQDFLGTPINIKKQETDALLTLQLEPDKTVKILSVGKASFIKQIRKSLFSDSHN